MAAKKTRTPKPKKICTACHKELPMTSFYMNKSPLHSLDQKDPICKDCAIKNSLNEETGEIDEIKFKNILRQLDKPYYIDNVVSARNQYKKEHSQVPDEDLKYYGFDILRLYFKNINTLRQLTFKTYADSEKDGFVQKHSTVVDRKNATSMAYEGKKSETKVELVDDNDAFELTDEIVQLFGEGYTKAEYRKMFNKYEKLKLNYSLQTNLHQEALATYVRFKVKEENATANGHVDEAKKWYDAAQNAASSGKLTPKQMSATDFNKGMNSVSELVRAVEQATDVIKVLPKFKYRPNDSVDFTIMCYVNYERKLNGQPEVTYEDIYSFYDKKKQEYIEQNGDPYGIFTYDTTEKNRDVVRKFLTMPEDYDEVISDEED